MSNNNDPVSTPRYVSGTPDWVKPFIDKASETHNVPSVILSALLKQESGFNPNAVSSAGAQGIAQFMPGTAQGRGVNPWNPEEAIMGAAQYLKEGLDKYGDVKKALASYNAGFGAVDRFGGIPPYQETQRYVKSILDMIGGVHKSYNQDNLDVVNSAKKQTQTQKPKGTPPAYINDKSVDLSNMGANQPKAQGDWIDKLMDWIHGNNIGDNTDYSSASPLSQRILNNYGTQSGIANTNYQIPEPNTGQNLDQNNQA